MSVAATTSPLLDLRDLKVHFPVRRGLLRRQVGSVRAVDGVSFVVGHNETLGLVGESGCGKTTLVQTILRLQPATSGEVWFANGHGPVNLLALPAAELRALRRQIQIVFQNPDSAMNPQMTAFDIIAEPLRLNERLTEAELNRRVHELMEAVGLSPQMRLRPPSAFSGGQRQRLVIARSLALAPRLLIADEPVSALDVSVQAQILNLLNDLKRRFQLTFLFIAHNLNVVRYMSDRIAVMYLGRIVEMGSADEVCEQPRHPYTRLLLTAIPATHPDHVLTLGTQPRAALETPHPSAAGAGCAFAPRCPHARQRCLSATPEDRELTPGHHVACHFAEEISPQGGPHATAHA